MSEVDDKKEEVQAEVKTDPDKDASVPTPEPEPAPSPAPTPAPTTTTTTATTTTKPAKDQGILVEQTAASDFSIIKADTSGPVVFGLMIVLGIILYLSYRAFAADYMLLFCGLFVFLGVYPAINLKVQNPNSKIILEVSIAFALCMCVFLILKSMNIPLEDHNKILIIFVTLLGMRYIFYPAYNVGVAEDQKASN